jgi:hypothetical protein
MGVVYLGQDDTGGPVAVKVIKAAFAADPEFRARFADEVAAAGRVAPFCTAQVLDADPDAPLPYLVTEYIDGIRLDHVVAAHQGPLALSTLQGVALGVASALTAIHGAGIVHRDLKPSNVLLSYSGPRVIDFGIARALDTLVGCTRSSLVLGSAGWMAPEHMAGAPVGPPADIFAWGLLVGYAAVGRHPFGDGAPLEVAQRMVMDRPSLDDVPPELCPLVAAALDRDPDIRPAAGQLVLSLLGDRGRSRSGTHAAVAEVLGGTWPGDRRPRPAPTAAPTPVPAGGRSGPAVPAGPEPYPPPRRQRRRPRIPGKRLLVLVLLVVLAISAIDRFSPIWNNQRGRLWEQVWMYVQDGFHREVEAIHREYHPMKQIVNDALRRALALRVARQEPYHLPPHESVMRPGFDPFGFNRLVDEWEDEAIVDNAQRDS